MHPRKKITLGKPFTEAQVRAVVEATLNTFKKRMPEIVPVTAPETGVLYEGHGVYLGIWVPKGRGGISLGQIFNVFAAPEDLTDASGSMTGFKYPEVITRLAEVKGWHGHDGEPLATDSALYMALRNGTYNGGWIVPPREILAGTDVDGGKGQVDHLLKHRDTGAFQGSFCTSINPNGPCALEWYFSCTMSPGNENMLYAARFIDKKQDTAHSTDAGFYKLSCRPVRLELKPG